MSLTPGDAAAGGARDVPDERLPYLAAEWLADGWGSDELAALAAMSPAEARTEARALLPGVLRSLGLLPPDPATPEQRFRAAVAWAVRAMDGRFTPYAAAQKVLEQVGDEPAAGPLAELVAGYDAATPAQRAAAGERIAAYLDGYGTTRLVRRVAAPPAAVYRALLDPDAVRRWMVPDGMTSEVHAYDARAGGAFRISLTYDAPTGAGKSGGRTDTFHGRFVRLVPDREVVQVVEFETADEAMRGAMTITYLLAADGGGTIVTGRHENLPPGVPPADNELGWRMSMDKLARLVEGGDPPTA